MIKNNSQDEIILREAHPELSDAINDIAGYSTTPNIKAVLDVLQDKYNRRKIIEISMIAIQESGLYESDVNSFKIAESMQEKLSILQNENSQSYPQHISELIGPVLDQCNVALNTGVPMGISTGLVDVDSIMGGMINGEFVIIAARPSMGKSALAGNIVRFNAIRKRIPTAIFTLEMSKTLTTGRLLFSEAEENLDAVLRGVAEKSAMHAVNFKKKELSESPIVIDDTAGISLTELYLKCEIIKRRWGLQLLIVDHIGLIGHHARGRSRNDEVSQISAAMKRIAINFNIPVIGLCQLSREVERRQPPEPMLSDLRDSGSLEQDADKVIMLYREEYYKPENGHYDEKKKIDIPSNRGQCKIIITKNKNGRVGYKDVYFDAPTMNFKNISDRI